MEPDRLIKLEVLAAEQEKTIEELSTELTRQWREMESLKRRLDKMMDRITELEDNAAGATPITKPPHW